MAAEAPAITIQADLARKPTRQQARRFGRNGLAILGATAAIAGCGSSPSPSPASHETPAQGTTATHSGPANPTHHSERLHVEIADNHNGTSLFGSPEGAAVPNGVPGSIPYGTKVEVACYAPNESGMASVNYFYLLKGGVHGHLADIKGTYAAANTFANGGPMGNNPDTLDPNVGKC